MRKILLGKCRYFSYNSFERLQSEKATAQTYFKGIDHQKGAFTLLDFGSYIDILYFKCLILNGQ